MFYSSNNPGFTTAAAVTVAQTLKLNGSGAVVPTSAATDIVIGVAYESADSGKKVAVVCSNVAEAIAGGNITEGQYVFPSTTSGAVTSSATRTDYAFGIALQSVSSGSTFLVKLF